MLIKNLRTGSVHSVTHAQVRLLTLTDPERLFSRNRLLRDGSDESEDESVFSLDEDPSHEY